MALGFGKNSGIKGEAQKSSVKYMKLNEGDNTFRIKPDSILPTYTYWVKGANGKDLPFECLQFDRATEKFDNTKGDPIKDLGLKNDKGEDLRCQWSYKCQVINKSTGELEVLQLKKGILQDIISVAGQLEMDPTDYEVGTWFTVNKKKTGPHAFNVEYTLQQLKCKPSELEAGEKELFDKSKDIEELFKLETYDEQMTRLQKHLKGAKEDAQESESNTDSEAINELD